MIRLSFRILFSSSSTTTKDTSNRAAVYDNIIAGSMCDDMNRAADSINNTTATSIILAFI